MGHTSWITYSSVYYGISAAGLYIFITYHVCFYAIAYYVGSNWKRLGKSTNKSAVIYFIVMCLAFATRFIGRIMIDGTKLYNLVIVNYIHIMWQQHVYLCYFQLSFSKAKMLKLYNWLMV